MIKSTLSLLAVLGLFAPCATRAAVTTSGNFQTGTPVPTLAFTNPFTLTITASGNASYLVFDEWVTSDGSQTSATASTNQTLSYQINGGTTQSIGVSLLYDNLSRTVGAATANDGILSFGGSIAVTAGQTLTFLPSSATFASGGTAFNPPPSAFTGNAFLIDGSGTAYSALGSVGAVPEPSTWALLGIGAVGTGVVARRRRQQAGT